MPNLQLFYLYFILHRMQDIRDVGVSFRHMFCIHHMALWTMHHGCDVVRRVLYLFYFLALPFSILFYFFPFILLQYLVFARKSLSVVGQVWVVRYAPPACIFINPTTVDVRHLRVRCVQPFLRPWQFHEHDGHMHRSQLVSNDQR